jgi:replicative DNA helicase
VNVRHYAAIVHEKAIARRVIFTASKVVAEAYEHERPVREILAEADTKLLELRQGYRDGSVLDLSKSTSDLMADLEFRVANRGKLTGLDTGFKSINDTTFGWQPGDYIIFAARPSMGKTALLLNTMRAGAEFPRADGSQRTALCFSMEMTRKQLQYRMLSSMSGIWAQRLAGGFVQGADFTALNEAIERMHNLRIVIDDRAARTVSDVRAEARRLHAESGIDLIVIDYVQLMGSVLERRGANRTEELADTSRKLKSLAKELNVPVILVSQLRRITGRPKLEDLRECGSLEQDADIVAFLHRKNHKEGGTTEFILEKNRNGPTGTELLTFHKETVNFTDGGVEPSPEERAKDEADDKKEERGRHRKRSFAKRAAGLD